MHAETMIVPTAAAHPSEQRLRMTYEEFLEWADEDTHAEWIDGAVIVFMPPLTIHQRLAFFLAKLLSTYAELFQLGEVLIPPYEMQLRPGGRSREPDVMFVAREQQGKITEQKLEGAADLVVEIISEDSIARDRIDKFTEYAAGGVREYWLIDPRPSKQRVDGYWLTAEGTYQAIVPDGEGRYHSHILPGFWFRAAWLCEEPLPDPIVRLAEIRGVAPEAVQAFWNMLRGE